MAENNELFEVLKEFDLAEIFDNEGIEYRETVGSRGPQLNVKTCFVCGTSKWKVYFNKETGLGNCFSGDCEAKFNKYSAIKGATELDGPALFSYIEGYAKNYGWRPKLKKQEEADAEKKELEMPYSFAIPHEGKNLSYLEDRNISEFIASYFQLRYSKTGVFQYSGLEGEPLAQDYARRVIIPILDVNRKLVSFQGRDVTGKAEKKYLFPPGFAATGSHLYNIANALNKKELLIGEGAFDVMAQKSALMSSKRHEHIEPIGTFGKHISEGNGNSQLQRFVFLKRHGLKQVTFMWDGEKIAISDAIKSGMLLKRLGLEVRVSILPDGKDPNEITHEELLKSYDEAITLNRLNAAQLLMKYK